MIDLLILIVTILGVLIIPIIVYVFKQHSEHISLKTKVELLQDNYKELQLEIKKDINLLFQKIDDLKDDFHRSFK